MNSMQGRPGNCFLHWSNKSETSAARHRNTSQRGRDLLLSYKFLSGVGAVLCTPTESERSPCASVQLDVHTHTHTHRASGIMYRVRRCKTYKFSTSLSVQWQQHIVMLLIAAQVVRRVN